MSDEGLEPTTTEEIEETGQDDRTPEELKAEITRLRREAAGRRVTNKKTSAELEEERRKADASKTELQLALERLNRLEADLAAERVAKLQMSAAKKAGLDLDLADRVRGETEDEMIEDAKALAQKAGGKKTGSSTNVFAGARGGAVEAVESPSDQFNKWIRSQ